MLSLVYYINPAAAAMARWRGEVYAVLTMAAAAGWWGWLLAEVEVGWTVAAMGWTVVVARRALEGSRAVEEAVAEDLVAVWEEDLRRLMEEEEEAEEEAEEAEEAERLRRRSVQRRRLGGG